MENQDEDLSHLVADAPSAASEVIQDIQAKIRKMRELEIDMLEKQELFKAAEKEFEEYKASVVLASMTSAGLNSIEDENGNFVKLETKWYCNPNKNDADRKIIEAWLMKQGGDFLIKRKGEVEAEQLDMMRSAGIPFAEKIDMNTNSLKAFLKDALGYTKGSVAKISLEEIPDCIHFVIANEVITG